MAPTDPRRTKFLKVGLLSRQRLVDNRNADKPDLCGCSMIRFIGGKRWIVERTFTGITTNRRLATDFEPFAAIVQALI
jgi:hypothetical protein